MDFHWGVPVINLQGNRIFFSCSYPVSSCSPFSPLIISSNGQVSHLGKTRILPFSFLQLTITHQRFNDLLVIDLQLSRYFLCRLFRALVILFDALDNLYQEFEYQVHRRTKGFGFIHDVVISYQNSRCRTVTIRCQ